MPQQLTQANLKAFFDANPGKYKTGAVLADGYLPTDQLGFALGASVGTVPNPFPQPTVSKPLTIAGVRSITPQTLGTLAAAPDYMIQLEVVAARIRVGDNAGLAAWGDTLLLLSKMPQAEHDSLTALCSATQLDPNWSPTVPGPSDMQTQFGVHTVLHSDIAGALGRAS